MKILIVFGGPSLERAISLNSARSLADHLYAFDVQQSWVFVSPTKRFHFIEKKWLYCNTIEDFEFKLQSGLSFDEFKNSCQQDDLIFSTIHGAFGEDGEFSAWLEASQMCFIGPSSSSCYQSYLKKNALETIHHMGLGAGQYLYLPYDFDVEQLSLFMRQFPDSQQFFMKPNAGGSSIGATPFKHTCDLLDQYRRFPEYYQQGIIVEPFYESADEFCVTLLGTGEDDQEIFSFAPARIDYQVGEFYDYRKKYLLSDHSYWECPAIWPSHYIQHIQDAAKKLYKTIKARGLLRIDGWLFEDGRIAFSDVNLISGLEQNSLVFRQAATSGLSHQAVCQWLIENVAHKKIEKKQNTVLSRRPVWIVFGGQSSEKYTSMLSAINVWLKLVSQSEFQVTPYFLDNDNSLRPVAYHAMLSHGLQGLKDAMLLSKRDVAAYRLPFADLQEGFLADQQYSLSINTFLQQAKHQNAFVFLALHGGDGENGVWQNWLTQYGVPFNGSGVQASQVGMDKKRTAELVEAMNHPKIRSLPKCVFDLRADEQHIFEMIDRFAEQYPCPWIIKPRAEGCSAGVLVAHHIDDAKSFVQHRLYAAKDQRILSDSIIQQWDQMEHCLEVQHWMIEPMIICDKLNFDADKNIYFEGQGWIELTQGVIQTGTEWKALPASLVIAANNILSLEEKFQSGTGTNITPVPGLSNEEYWWLSRAIVQVAETLGLEQYARFDLFYHRHTRDIIIIEANTLPGLTASTVLFHQLILENWLPQEFLNWLINPANQPRRLALELSPSAQKVME